MLIPRAPFPCKIWRCCTEIRSIRSCLLNQSADPASSSAVKVTAIDYTILSEGVPARPGRPHSNALVFLRSMPNLGLEEPPEDFPPCAICLTSFFAPHSEEKPVLLPCGHVLRRNCASRWLCPLAEENNNTWYAFSEFISFFEAST